MAISKQIKHLYEFEDFRLDVTDRFLWRDGKLVPLSPKVFDTLLALVEHSGQILEKEELLQIVWPDSFVEESSLSQNIFQLRKALGDNNSEQRFIETIPKRGYRFVAEVREVLDGSLDLLEDRAIETRLGTVATATQVEVRPFIEPTLQEGHSLEAESDFLPVTVSPSLPPALPQVRTAAPKGFLWKSLAIGLGLLVFAIAVGAALQKFSGKYRPAFHLNSFQNMQVSRLTTSGNALLPAMSPDGKYITHVFEKEGLQSLWVRQTATPSNVQLVPPADVIYQGTAFSQDGNFIYYLTYTKPKRMGVLYRIPLLGGTPQKVVQDIDSPPTFSPDGKHMAFVRNFPNDKSTSLIITALDGSNERKLINHPFAQGLSFAGPSWSPDGTVIAISARLGNRNEDFMHVLAVNAETGEEMPLTKQEWTWVGQVSWAADGSGVLAVAWNQNAVVFADQIWFLPFPEGEARRITNDPNGYTSLSAATQTDSLVTMQSSRFARMWIVPLESPATAKQIPTGFNETYSDFFGMDWTPDGRIVFGSHASGNSDLWVMDQNGGNLRQLTTDIHSDLLPQVTADGRKILYLSAQSGQLCVWSMNLDGSEQKQITTETAQDPPAVSPDGKWVYFTVGVDKPRLWRAPVDGGAAQQVSDLNLRRPALSPDGAKAVCYLRDPASGQVRLGLVDLATSQLERTLEAPRNRQFPVFFAPDGNSIYFVDMENGIANIYRKALDDTPRQQVTNFTSETIFRFTLSKDGKYFACERGETVNDLVLIRGFK
ncbi:MAG: winged helix-turn-helix domain-containing protein [Blastocatellia bacterium]|nr:winged helix-turn-helix domain-containing protein [Blastocatellia bacterium]